MVILRCRLKIKQLIEQYKQLNEIEIQDMQKALDVNDIKEYHVRKYKTFYNEYDLYYADDDDYNCLIKEDDYIHLCNDLAKAYAFYLGDGFEDLFDYRQLAQYMLERDIYFIHNTIVMLNAHDEDMDMIKEVDYSYHKDYLIIRF